MSEITKNDKRLAICCTAEAEKQIESCEYREGHVLRGNGIFNLDLRYKQQSPTSRQLIVCFTFHEIQCLDAFQHMDVFL